MTAPLSVAESSVRARAARRGYIVNKARGNLHLNNKGEFMLTEAYRNTPVLGWDYDASIEDIAEFLDDLDRAEDASA